MKRTIYTREELTDVLAALLMANVQAAALHIVAAALGVDWFDVLVKAGRLVESQPGRVGA